MFSEYQNPLTRPRKGNCINVQEVCHFFTTSISIINAEMDQAFVYLGNQQFGLSGFGDAYLLIKVNGEWIVEDVVPLWIS